MSRPQKSNSVVKISLWPINQWYDINHTLRVRMWEHFWVFKPLKWSEMKQGRPLINSNTDTLDTYGLTMYMHGKKKKKKKAWSHYCPYCTFSWTSSYDTEIQSFPPDLLWSKTTLDQKHRGFFFCVCVSLSSSNNHSC